MFYANFTEFSNLQKLKAVLNNRLHSFGGDFFRGVQLQKSPHCFPSRFKHFLICKDRLQITFGHGP